MGENGISGNPEIGISGIAITSRGGDLQGGVICRRCNAKAVNLAGGELRCGEIGAVIVSADISEAVKCGAPSKKVH